jgi:hypothetical protein
MVTCETLFPEEPPLYMLHTRIGFSRLLFCVRFFLLLTVFCLISAPLFAACHAVMPTAQGTGSGTSWTNAMAYSSLAGSHWVRGDTYYLADGNYGTSLSITTSASGTTAITIKKAQAYDYGRASDGCPNDISAGWNASTMGAAQAIWQNTSSGGSPVVNLGSGGYYIFNGNGQILPMEVGCGGVQANPGASMASPAPVPSNCGIRIDDSTCTSTGTDTCTPTGVMYGGGPGIQWLGVEWKGQGLNPSGNNDSEAYFWFASGGNLNGVIISHCYIHQMSTTAFTVVSGGWNGGSFDHNYAWGEFDGSVNHGESVQLQGPNGQSSPDNISNNIFRDQQTNGDVVATDLSGNSQTYNFYNNVDFCSAGGTSTSCRHNDGIIGCFGTSKCTNVNVYDNTFSVPSDCGFNISGGAGTISWKDNLLYACGAMTTNNGSGGTNTIDYNSYLNSNLQAIGSHDVVNNSVTNPFVNLTNGNVQLLLDGSNLNNRLSLGSPFDSSGIYGSPFTTDRGAAQFAPGSAINLTGSIGSQ